MVSQTNREDASAKVEVKRLTLGLVLFQFVFGLLWFGTASVLTGEPELTLSREDHGRVDLEYSLHLYGVIPARHVRIQDVSPDYRLSSTLADVERRGDDGRGPGTTSALQVQTHNWITFSDSNGITSARLPGVFDTSGISSFFGGTAQSYRERYTAGPARRYGMGFVGALGGLVFLGGIWNTLRFALWKIGVKKSRPEVPA